MSSAADWSVPERYRGRIVGSGKRGIPRKAVALTFDDGPSANITPQVLDTLKQHHAVATFFVMGQQVKQYPKLLQQEVAQGHVIGYHTYTHALRPTLSQAQREMEQTRQVVQQTIGRDTVLFRPPYGNTRSNYTRIARDRIAPLSSGTYRAQTQPPATLTSCWKTAYPISIPATSS